MGCTNSKLPDHELEELLKLTYFDEKRLQRGYRCFMGVCPDGKMDLIKFKRFYKGLYPSGDPSQFASYVFKVIDTDDDGYINFKEFICFMSTASLGEVDEQIEWAFKLYDINNDGYVTRDELLSITKALYKMVSSSYKSLSEEYTPEERVENSFKLLGKNIDEKLTLEEFQKGINRGYAALRILQLYEYIL